MSTPDVRPDAIDRRLANLPPERELLLRRLLREEGLGLARLPIPRVSRDGTPFPLSFAQERLWFLEQLAPGSPAYNVHVALRLRSRIDVAALERSIGYLVERHEMLRSRIIVASGEPRQEILSDAHVILDVADLQHIEPGERMAEAKRLATVEAQTPFDLAAGPLFRARLLQLTSDDGVLLLTVHHLISDGWSMDVLNRELDVCYRAFASGRSPELSPLPIQYVDFAAWQRASAEDDEVKSQLAYWMTRLADAPRFLDLPADRPRPPQPTLRGARQCRVLPRQLADALRSLSQAEGVTPFMTLLASFAVLLQRYTARDDIVVGSPIANRARPEVAGLVGFFINTLIMRLDLSGAPSFRALMQRVRQTTLEAFEHPDVPFERLIQQLNPERDLSRTPFFQVSFQLYAIAHSPDSPAPSPAIEIDKGTATVDLALDMEDGPRGLVANVEYATDRFDDDRIERMLDHFERLLTAIVAEPDAAVTQLPILTDREIAQLDAWNQTDAELPGPDLLHELVLDRLNARTHAPAIVDGGVVLTRGEIAARARGIASRLHRDGFRPETLVAIAVEQTSDFVSAALGVLLAGGAYVPLDVTWPTRRVSLLLEEASPSIIITRGGLRERLGATAVPILDIDDPPVVDADEWASIAPAGARGDGLAYVIFTSGSTGRPRGVMVEHRSVANHVKWMMRDLPLTESDRVLQQYTPTFDASIAEIFPALAAGAVLVAPSPAERRDIAALAALVARERVTVVDVVPSVLQALLEMPAFVASPSLRRIVCGGEELSQKLHAAARAAVRAQLVNIYGPTEATVGATYWVSIDEPAGASIPIGYPIANARVYVVDREMNRLPIGVPGELAIGGVPVARGYLDATDSTASRFVPDPFSHARDARLLRTGDRARFRSDGALEFFGRLDDQLKLRGIRIEPAEIEAVLARHPSVQRVVVVERGSALQEALPNVVLSDDALDEALQSLPADIAESLLDHAVGAAREHTPAAHGSTRSTRRRRGFELALDADATLMQRSSRAQREWLIERTLDEAADDLDHFDELAARFVEGSGRPTIERAWATSEAEWSANSLTIDGQQVMQAWERPLMQALADIASASHGDVLEIGFGMGISASMIQRAGVRSHTIVESNDDVFAAAERWRARHAERTIDLVHAPWHEAVARLRPVDAILFDAYPQSEDEFRATVLESSTFAESFFAHAVRLLRPGGTFTYYTNEIDSFSRRHQRSLLAHFSSFTLSVVRGLAPPQDCQYWWADSMAVVRAEK